MRDGVASLMFHPDEAAKCLRNGLPPKRRKQVRCVTCVRFDIALFLSGLFTKKNIYISRSEVLTPYCEEKGLN